MAFVLFVFRVGGLVACRNDDDAFSNKWNDLMQSIAGEEKGDGGKEEQLGESSFDLEI